MFRQLHTQLIDRKACRKLADIGPGWKGGTRNQRQSQSSPKSCTPSRAAVGSSAALQVAKPATRRAARHAASFMAGVGGAGVGGKEGGGEVGRGRGRWRAGAGRPGKEREAEGGAVMGPRAAPGLARPPPAPRLCSRLDPLNCMRRASYAVEEEVVDLGTSARSRHNVLACRSGAPAAEQPRINGMTLWPVGNLLWPILGALAYSTA